MGEYKKMKKDDSEYFLNLGEIKDSENQNKGKSASKTVSQGKDTYQLKSSAHDEAGILRRTFWDKSNADIISEFIATRLAQTFMPKELDGPELIPDVKLGIEDGKIRLASKYLNSGVENFLGGTLDDLFHKKILGEENLNKSKNSLKDIKEKYKHPVITAADKDENKDNPKHIEVGKKIEGNFFGKEEPKQEITLDKKELYKAIITSIVLGDHDVNPGNMYITYDKNNKSSHIGRIDFGHAFNDLRRDIYDKPNLKDGVVLDFLNRSVGGGEGKIGNSKFRRDYRGVSLDPNFAKSLREFSNNSNKEDFHNVLKETIGALSDLAEKHPRISGNIKSSVGTIYKRLTGEEIPKNLDLKTSLGFLEEGIGKFIENNINEARSVANLIDVQNLVKRCSKTGIYEREVLGISLAIAHLYSEDKKHLSGKKMNDSVPWVRDDSGNPKDPLSLKEYINQSVTNKDIANCLISNLDRIENGVHVSLDQKKSSTNKIEVPTKKQESINKEPINLGMIDEVKHYFKDRDIMFKVNQKQNSVSKQSTGADLGEVGDYNRVTPRKRGIGVVKRNATEGHSK